MKKEDWEKTFGLQRALEIALPAFILMPAAFVIYLVTESRAPTVGEVVFFAVWEAVFLAWARARKVWPFGPW
jgi:membrane-bound metal-dependent hydrolase YbcI (DUF457 family)